MAGMNIPRALERYPLGTKIDGAGDRWGATDRDRGRDVTVTRVAFGPERREQRDALVERVRALFSVNSPALVAALDAGAWEDDAFVVEERVVEPQPIGAADLDAREKALAARSIAEGVAALDAAGWALPSLDVVVDAYRQPRIAMALDAERATESTRATELERLQVIVRELVPGAPSASSASALAKAIDVPVAGPSTPLVHGTKPTSSPMLWVAVVIGVVVIGALASMLGH